MAITRGDFEIFKRIKSILRPRPEILELGEAEFYGDVPLSELRMYIRLHGTGQHFMDLSGLEAVIRSGGGASFALGKLVYRMIFDPRKVDTIDLHGTPRAEKLDLNEPIAKHGYDLVYNTGTAEHVFDIARVLRSCHEAVDKGGIMAHCFPFRGLFDHGFWAVNPTLIYDLASANGYEILCVAMSSLSGHFEWVERSLLHGRTDLPDNAWLHVAYRKTSGHDFLIPMQGHYRPGTTQEEKAKWLANR